MNSCDMYGCFVLDFLFVSLYVAICSVATHCGVILPGGMPSLPSSERADCSLPETRAGGHCLQPSWLSGSHVETPR